MLGPIPKKGSALFNPQKLPPSTKGIASKAERELGMFLLKADRYKCEVVYQSLRLLVINV